MNWKYLKLEFRFQVSSISESSGNKIKSVCLFFRRSYGSTILFRYLLAFTPLSPRFSDSPTSPKSSIIIKRARIWQLDPAPLSLFVWIEIICHTSWERCPSSKTNNIIAVLQYVRPSDFHIDNFLFSLIELLCLFSTFLVSKVPIILESFRRSCSDLLEQ